MFQLRPSALIFPLLLAMFLVFQACSSPGEKETSEASSSSQNDTELSGGPEAGKVGSGMDPEKTDETEAGSATANDGKTAIWKGQINQKIPVTLDLQMTDDLAYGSLVYDKVGNSIQLIGQEEWEGNYRIYEFEASGNITGIWTLKFTDEEAEGTWFSPVTRESMPVLLNTSGTGGAATDLTHESVVGHYYYSYGEEGGSGSVDVTGFEEGNIFYELLCVTAPPATHIASLEEAEGIMMGNKVQVRMNEDEFIDCAFDIRFFKDFVVIDYVDDKMDCGFGHNAFVSGVFLKTK